MREHQSPSHELSPSRQTRGAITLTVAAVVLSSGLWGLWYTPTSTYEPRKNEQIGNIELILQANTTIAKVFEVKQGVQELSIGIRAQTIMDIDANQTIYPAEIPAIFSARILNPEGKTIARFDNVTSIGTGERIPFQQSGSLQIELTNASSENNLALQMQVMDVTKIVNHPLEAMGQWLTIISTPVFGLGAWFVVSKLRHSNIV
jgi:hypothetical protein